MVARGGSTGVEEFSAGKATDCSICRNTGSNSLKCDGAAGARGRQCRWKASLKGVWWMISMRSEFAAPTDHSWKFDLATGEALFGDCGIKTYQVRVDEAGRILLTLEMS